MKIPISLLILTGGKSSRMGRDKASLPWQDGTFLTTLLRRSLTISFTNIIVSTNHPADVSTLPGRLFSSTKELLTPEETTALAPQDTPYYWETPCGQLLPFYLVADTFSDCGPLGGMEAGMSACVSPWYAVVSVDMPYYDFAFVADQLDKLSRYTGSERPVFLPVLGENLPLKQRLQPLAALYPRALLPQIRQSLQDKDFHVRYTFRSYPTVLVDESARQQVYTNINTPLEYKDAYVKEIMKTRRVPVFSITADASHTGKTTVCTALIKLLVGHGYRVGYIKSSHHMVTGEKAGSDMARAKAAGAYMTRIVTPADVPVGEDKEAYIFHLSQRFPVDIVLVESRRHGPLPRIKLCLFGPDAEALDCTSGVIAVISYKGNPLNPKVHQFSRDNLAPVFAYIKEFLL